MTPGPRASSAIGCFLAVLCMSEAAAGGAGPENSAKIGPVGFVDATSAIGLDYRVEEDPRDRDDLMGSANAGGLTLFDMDGNGRLDLYVAHGQFEKGRLFSWDGRRFARRDGNAGIAPAAIDRAGYFFDLDRDGRSEFISLHKSGVQVFRHDGSGRFEPDGAAFVSRVGVGAYSMAAGDYDGDGDLDLFFARYAVPRNPVRALSGHLWRNDGKGRYEDVSHIVPIRPVLTALSPFKHVFSFTPTFADFDGDGDPDILLAADYGASQILRNEGGTHFTDLTGPVVTDENGMGGAVGDFDRDGDLDWFVTSIHGPDIDPSRGRGARMSEGPDGGGRPLVGRTGNRLYRNVGGGRFEDATEQAGVRDGGWGWGTCMEDFDNDGNPDLFHTNGWHQFEQFREDRSRLFMSNGDGTFTERASELGIDHTGQGRGAVCADYDGDGRVDIFIANNGAAPTVYRNVFENGNRWLAVDLAGRDPNPHGIGAVVTVRTASGRQIREMRMGGSYLSQAPPLLHFGMGRDRIAASIEVRWPGPGNRTSRLENVAVDRRLTIRQPAPQGHLLSVARGRGSGLYVGGAPVRIAAEAPRGHYRFSHWSSEGGGAFEDARSPETVFTMPANGAAVFAHFLPGPAGSGAEVSAARRWMEVLLQAIRDDLARPTVHARNLFHLSAAMYDAWASYSETATPYLLGVEGEPCRPSAAPAGPRLWKAREEAIGHAAWRLIRHRFESSPGAASTARNANALMAALGYGTGPPESGAAALGRCIAGLYIARGLADGSNEANDYRSDGYRPVNESLNPNVAGNGELANPDRWQPLTLINYIDQSGYRGPEAPAFVTPGWGRAAPFALTEEHLTIRRREDTAYYVWRDPGGPPTHSGPRAKDYKWGFGLVARWSSQLSPDDGVLIDIAPSGLGNAGALPRRFEEYPGFYDSPAVNGPGHRINPATGKSYEPQMVPRGDYARVLAEFWADGPDSETPPGHWFVILNAVNDHPLLVRRLGGEGPELEPLEWDVKAYFALGGAMHDAAIAAWSVKGWYDYIRPISALRGMADRGQASDPALPSYAAGGMLLDKGFVELVGPADPLAGPDGEHVGEIKLRAWRGPEAIRHPESDAAGVGWVLAGKWWPYQRPSFVTPPFAGYVSGHSTFSRAAAEVLAAFTGDPFFPGGMSEFRIQANEYLVFERGPSVDMTLQWATYRDAADQCSLSRIWGGIHPPADDIPGRLIGAGTGRDAFRFAESHF